MKTVTTMLIAAAVLLAVSNAYAGPIDLTAEVTQLNGKPLLNEKGEPQKTTLGEIIENSLLVTDPAMTPADKNKRFFLALKLHRQKKVELTVEEVALIKEVVSKYGTVLVVGQIIRMIDPASVPKN